MGFEKITINLVKIGFILLAFAIVLYALIQFREWGAEFTLFFFRTGNWGMIILISLIIAAISGVLIKLLQLHFRMQTRGRRIRRRRQ